MVSALFRVNRFSLLMKDVNFSIKDWTNGINISTGELG